MALADSTRRHLQKIPANVQNTKYEGEKIERYTEQDIHFTRSYFTPAHQPQPNPIPLELHHP